MSWANNNFMGGYESMNIRRTPSYIPGKMVNSHDEIVPQDVPLNGQPAVFPTADWSCIYAKTWSQGGSTIETRKYVLEENAQNKPNLEQTIANALAIISDQMDGFQKELETIKEQQKKSNYYRKHNNRQKSQNEKKGDKE